MVHTCYNKVKFKGTSWEKKSILKAFMDMAMTQEKYNVGLLPQPVIEWDKLFFYKTRLERSYIYYETKWEPNTPVLVDLAKHFQVDFIHTYHQDTDKIYGLAVYRSNVLQCANIDDLDLLCPSYDAQTNQFIFEGLPYKTEKEIFEILVQRKVVKLGLKIW